MGIQGLLPFLKTIHEEVNIAQFSGCTVAIDAYCWLHKGAFSCAEKLALGEKTDQYVYYCMKYVDYMLKHNLKPILVFDGCHLKSKAGVEKSRRERREINRKKAAQFLREGRRAEAKECLQRCVDISPQMALELMNACRQKGVDCIVAPYEADAQLGYLSRKGIAQIIVTEDSDLLLFGCEKIIFKMDFNGRGVLIQQSRLNEVMDIQTGFYTFEKFRYMCILSGCDYLPSLHGIGLAKACKVFKMARQADIRQVLKKLPMYLKMNLCVTNEYVEGFVRADNTFLYQLVFDPMTRELCPLNPYPPEIDENELDYAGQYFPKEKAYQMSLGNIDVHSHKAIANFDPDTFVPKNKPPARFRHLLSIWDRNYCIKSESPCKEVQPSQAERLSLRNEERTVKVKLFQKSPAKRQRDPSNSRDKSVVGSDAKRMKHLEVDDILGMLDQDENVDTSLNDSHASPLGEKKLLSESLSNADSDRGSWESEDENEDILCRKKHKKSLSAMKQDWESKEALGFIKHNVFAVPADAPKAPRFNINATVERVEVKSRYFASSQGVSPRASTKLESRKALSSPRKKPSSASNKKEKPSECGQPNIRLMFAEQAKHCSLRKEDKGSDDSRDFGKDVSKCQNSDLNGIKHQSHNKIAVGGVSKKVSSSNKVLSNSSKRLGGSSAFAWAKYKFTPRQDTPQSKATEFVPVNVDNAGDSSRLEKEEEDVCVIEQEEKTKSERAGSRSTLTESPSVASLSRYFSKSDSVQIPKNQRGSIHSVQTIRSPQNSQDSCTDSEDVREVQAVDYKDFLCSVEGCERESLVESGDKRSEVSSEDSDSTLEISVNESQRSSIGSIDSFCLPNTQDFIDLTDTEPDCEVTKITKKSTSTASAPSGKQSCRVPGLSRSRRKAKVSPGRGQQKLHSLSRFAFTRNASKPSIPSTGTGEDSDSDSQQTPITHAPDSSALAKVQRRLEL